MKKKLLILLALTLILISFAACGGSGEGTLVGTWSTDGAPDALFIFNEDGTGELDSGIAVLEFDWTADGNSLTLVNNDEGVHDEMEFEVDGDTLTLSTAVGTIRTYTRVG